MQVLSKIGGQSRKALHGQDPYSAPIRKRPARATLWRVGACSLHIIGIGHIKIAKSVKIQGRGPMMLNTYLFPQLFGMVGSQLDLTGWHMRAPPRASERHQHTTTTISMFAVSRKARVMKIRRKNIRTDIFAHANKVGCKTEPTKKTYSNEIS